MFRCVSPFARGGLTCPLNCYAKYTSCPGDIHAAARQAVPLLAMLSDSGYVLPISFARREYQLTNGRSPAFVSSEYVRRHIAKSVAE